jgi:hypothetical protein
MKELQQLVSTGFRRASRLPSDAPSRRRARLRHLLFTMRSQDQIMTEPFLPQPSRHDA